jgi:hypothetical protein
LEEAKQLEDPYTITKAQAFARRREGFFAISYEVKAGVAIS